MLRAEGYAVEVAARGDDGFGRAQSQSFDVVITDFKLPGLSGLDLIGRLHRLNPKLPIIMMTAHGTTETAIEATKSGACEYVVKPCDPDEILAMVAVAASNAKRMTEPVDLGDSRLSQLAIIGNSRPMQNVYKEIGRVAATPVTVLIRGDTGTGKELIARALYQHSNRADKPFIAVNCAAIPETLLESELFGHERGAFTGAHSRRIGRFEQAHGGTLFLDEVGDLTPSTQAKLLRVLQERQITRLGSGDVISVDVRLIAATHRRLETAIQHREFREDLFYRLSVVTIHLPALSERREDIPALVKYFVQRFAVEIGIESPSLQSEAITLLQNHDWPGNVRELENAVRQALIVSRPFPISQDHIQQVLKSRAPAAVAQQSHAAYISDLLSRAQRGEITDVHGRMIDDLEAELFSQAIKLADGNQAKAARWLGVTRLKMRERLAQLGLRSNKSD
ncbi:MAG TPA: sigma-54 dependent transcriptional regulator [Verrucomicrobiae bacterium]|nr:sigma-54 dependent transcriptional regulator [Verrucomicrobiae bacterium]